MSRGSVPTITPIVCGSTIGWGRSDRSPATRALLDIRVVALRVVTIIPRGRWRRGSSWRRGFDIDRRGRDHHRRVIIGSPVGFPIRSPVRSDPEEHTGASEAMMAAKPVVPTKPMMPTKPMVPTKPMMAAKPVGAPSGVPAPYAGHEQHCQHHDDPYPLEWSASALISRPHRA